MRFSNYVPSRTCTCVLLSCLVARTSAYFMINNPGVGTSWSNDAANLITWSKGVLDGVDTFDIEMTRLSHDGLMFVAKDVSATTKSKSVNIYLKDVPAGDDYFLLFINSTHGIMYATSSRFTVLPSGTKANASQPQADGSAATVTISGGPNPTAAFATTFPPVANGAAGSGLESLRSWSGGSLALASILAGYAVGALWTLW